MSGAILLIGAFIFFLAGYFLYGRRIERRMKISNDNITPAHKLRDNLDYVPAKAPVLAGHHFASIAGAAPIIGPVTAAVFGWGAAFTWIIIGGVFLGGIHDFTSMMASVRTDGKSIGEIIEREVGKTGKTLFLIFTWLTLVLIIAVFAFVVAKTFNKSGESASASIYFIALAVIFGFLLFKNILSFKILTIAGIILLGAGVYMCNILPINLSLNSWMFLIFGYIFLASVLPVWILLQPRDYLSSFLLYAIMIIAFVSILFYNPQIQFEAFTGFSNEHLGYIFPFLFVTIACGAISGFHSIVSSGTSSKQLNKESDALPVAYGSMLVESMLAVIALITAVYLSNSEYTSLLKDKGPIAIFAGGIAQFGTSIGIPVAYLSTFALLAISAFALTSLDTATRLARFSWQELFDGHKILSNKYLSTAIAVAAGGGLAFSGYWKQIWPLFGAANQMLAALALLAGYLWFKSKNKGHVYFLLLPMLFMYAVTITALAFLIINNITGSDISILRASIAAILLALALILLIIGMRSIFRQNKKAEIP